MQKKVIKEKEHQGAYTRVESVEKGFEDGFVHEADFHQVGQDYYGKFHMGAAKDVTITTNDPRITRPFLKIVCGIFFTIGLLMLVLGLITSSLFYILFGVTFIVFISYVYFKGKKPIDEIEEELKQTVEYQSYYNYERKISYCRLSSCSFSWHFSKCLCTGF